MDSCENVGLTNYKTGLPLVTLPTPTQMGTSKTGW